MGMGISMVGEWEWEWEWLYGNGREWESERHSRTPLFCTQQWALPVTVGVHGVSSRICQLMGSLK